MPLNTLNAVDYLKTPSQFFYWARDYYRWLKAGRYYNALITLRIMADDVELLFQTYRVDTSGKAQRFLRAIYRMFAAYGDFDKIVPNSEDPEDFIIILQLYKRVKSYK